MSQMRRRQPFYQKDIHNSTFYHNHRYFVDNQRPQHSLDDRTNSRKLHREFVQLPQPFGVDFTYKYLRKANMDCIPDWQTETRGRTRARPRRFLTSPATHQRLSSDILKTESSLQPLSPNNNGHPKTVGFDNQTTIMPVVHERLLAKVLLYDRLELGKEQIEVDVHKFIFGCFLKCQLRLDHLTVEQYRVFSEFVPKALEHRSQQQYRHYIPKAELGFNSIRTVPDLLRRFMDFRDAGRQEQMHRMLDYYILPEQEVLDYQLGRFLSEVDHQVKRLLADPYQQNYSFLYLFNGHSLQRVSNVFELDTELPIVASKHEIADTLTVVRYRQTLLDKFRERQKRNSLKSSSDHNHPPTLNTNKLMLTYRRIDQMLQEKQKCKRSYRSKLKYHNPLLDVRPPFIDKAKLIKEPSLFE